MEGLLRFERAVTKVEGLVLAVALLAMLGLALYGIAYRNLVGPLVTRLQVADRAAPAGEDEPAPDFDSDFGPGAAGAPAGTEAPPGPSVPESDFDSDFGGAGDAPGAAAAPAPTPAAPPAETAAAPTPERPDPPLVKLLLWLNFDWVDIVLRHLILWVGFLGGAIATQRRKHIAIDALARRMPPKTRAPIALVVAVASFLTCAALAYAAGRFTALEAAHGANLFGAVPGWVGPAVIPLGFGLIALHYLVRVIEAAAALAGKHELPSDILEVTLQ